MKLCPYCHNPLSDAEVAQLQAENAKLQAEIAELEGTIECLKGLAEATSAENAELRNQLEEQRCFAADLMRDIRELRELIRHMHCCSNNEYTEYGIDFIAAHCKDCEYGNDFGHCNFERRMAELGIEVGE